MVLGNLLRAPSILSRSRREPEPELDDGHGHPGPAVFPIIPTKLGYDFEVFLSFRGPDTRKTFTDHLYNDLIEAGVRTFRDNDELPPGEVIGTILLDAINQSKISIPVFSKGYASSRWCLMELVQMVECTKNKEHKILPIFLDVTPNEVRHQLGEYEKSFEKHQTKYDPEDVQKWRETLALVGSLKGLDLETANGYQGRLSKMVVSKVFKELKRQYLDVTENLVGIDNHVDEIMNLIDIEIKEEVRIVGIWGMAGVGKTTIAKFIYNQLMPDFDCCSFLADVREKSKSKGVEYLQRQLLSDLTRHNHDEIANVDSGKYMFKNRFLHKKVLILLDDVDHAAILNDLVPKVQSIAPGSRIIITTRDRSVLDAHQIDLICRVTEMNPDDSFLLFCKYVFRQDYPVAEFADLSWQIAKASGGLPLAIKVIGSYLSYNLRKDIWLEELGRLSLRKKPEIQETLMISFNALDPEAKEIFLDIACLFNGMDRRIPFHMWKACQFSPVSTITDLFRKSLITVGDDDRLWMHDQLMELGREIVRAENCTPGKQSRLWCSEDGAQVLDNEEGSDKVKGICLDSGQELEGTHFSGQMFQKLPNLQLLELGSAKLGGQFKECLSRLRWLSWHGKTVVTIPSDFHLKNLVVLDLSNSAISESWEGWSSIKAAKKLEVLNLTSCQQLTKTPDFTSFESIKRLILEDCCGLSEVDPSIKHLKLLESLNIKNCQKLDQLPQELGSLAALTELILDETPIKEIPISTKMGNLETLSLKSCKSLTQLPESVKFLGKLRWLCLDNCRLLTKIPDSISQLDSLEELNLSHTSVEFLPHSVHKLRNLKVLDVSCSMIRSLPRALGYLEKLEVINASGCRSLEGEVPIWYGNLKSLKILRLDSGRIKEIPSVWKHPRLQTLHIQCCEFPKNTLLWLPVGLVNLRVNCISSTTEFRNLSELISLKELEFSECIQLTHIPNGIEKLPKLRKLKFHSTSIDAIPQTIVKLAMLQELSIKDCEKLQSLPKLPSSLSKLHISGCSSLESLSELSELENLSSFSVLKCNRISAIRGLEGLVSLKTLRLSCHLVRHFRIPRISSSGSLFLEGHSWLKSLDLWAQRGIFHIEVVNSENLQSIQGLSSLCTLKSLTISHCKMLQELKWIGGLESLEKLCICQCEAIQTLPNLSRLQRLKELNLSGCEKLTEIKGLMELELLEKLDISGCSLLNEMLLKRDSLFLLEQRQWRVHILQRAVGSVCN